MQLHKPLVAGDPRAQVMGTQYAGDAARQFQHVLADLRRQFFIHQHRKALPGDLHSAPQNVGGDSQTEPGVDLMQSKPGQHQRDQNAAVEQHVRAVVQGVGAHRVGAGGLDHPMLKHQQRQGQHEGKHNHADTDPRRAHGLGMLQPIVGLQRDQYRTAADEQRLGHARQ
ncbi:hypothetical protein D3C81_1490960 [compost metagenome]